MTTDYTSAGAALVQGSGASGPVVMAEDKGQGNPLSRTVAPAPFNDRFQVYFGNRLTPQVVTQAISLANIGQLYLLADILDEVLEMDPHLFSVIQKRVMQVSSAKWSLVAEDVKDNDAVAIAAWCEKELRAQRNFRRCIAHMMMALYQGHGVVEQRWFPDGKTLRLLSMTPLHARRFGYGQQSWDLHLWDQTGNELEPSLSSYPGVNLKAFPQGKFIVHTPHVRGGYPTREGLGRTAVWFAMFKRWTWRDWMSLAEWAGRGIRVGTYTTGTLTEAGRTLGRALDEDVQALSDAMQYMSSSLQVMLPDTVSLQIHELKAATHSIHQTLSNECDSQNSKLVLGGTLTTDAGTHGARSLGDTQREDQMLLGVSDAENISETLRHDTLTPMVRFRFGAGSPVPLFKIHNEPRESLDSMATRIDLLAKAGLRIPESYVYELFSIPPPEVGEQVLVPRKPVEDPSVGNVDEAPAESTGGDGILPDAQPTPAGDTPASG